MKEDDSRKLTQSMKVVRWLMQTL